MRLVPAAITRRLSRRQAVWAAALGLTVGAGLAAVQIYADMMRERVRIDGLGESLLSPLHESLVLIAFRLDDNAASNLLNGVLNEPSVAKVRITDDFDDTLAEVARPLRPTALQNLGRVFGSDRIVTERELSVDGLGTVGRVTIEIDPLVASDGFSQRTAIVLASGLVKSLMLSFALSLLFNRMTTRRIERLSRRFGPLPRAHEPQDGDEIDSLEALLARWQRDKGALIGSLDKALEKTRLATSAADLAIWEYDTSDGSLAWEPEMFALFGVAPEDFQGRLDDFADRLHADDRERVIEGFTASLDSLAPFQDRFRIVTPAGEEKTLMARATFLASASGKGVRAIGVNADVTKDARREMALHDAHRRLETALRRSDHDASHDVLTGLGNRRSLSDHLTHLARNRPADAAVCFLHIDLDRFKSINDVFGHRAGDHLLREIAERLKALVTEADFVARVGGDEFAIVLSDPGRVAAADFVADTIVDACARPVAFGDALLRVGASIGLADAPASRLETLDADADIALYEAKKAGRGRRVRFDGRLREAAEGRKILADRLIEALAGDGLGIVMQPQVDAGDGTLVGFEALVRWKDPVLGCVPPDRFLPIASEIGVLAQVDAFVLSATLRLVRRLQEAGFPVPRVAVNVSLPRLMDHTLLDSLGRIGAWPCPLSFELLETMDFDAFGDDLAAMLAGLRDRNIGVEIDDFGSGYASVSAVAKIRPDGIKLDRSITNVDTDPDTSVPIVTALVTMAKGLGIQVTAEGVETARQAELLRALGCDALQGFHFAEPMTEADLIEWLRQRAPAPPVRSVQSG